MERLQAARIALPGVEVRIAERCASTNTALLSEESAATVLLAAEAQTAGRGQRGRRWQSTPGDITFSLARSLRRAPRELGSLSLVAGVAACRALRGVGVGGVSLKWPNDLMVNEAKLGGILVETRPQSGLTRAVIGIGINCRRATGLEARLKRRIACLEERIAPDRSAVIRQIAGALLVALERFEEEGFSALREEWQAMDAFAGRRLRVRLADGRAVSGIAGGVAADGALRLLTRAGERTVHSGRILSAGAA